jgi:hypothetical protein
MGHENLKRCAFIASLTLVPVYPQALERVESEKKLGSDFLWRRLT